MSEISSHRKIQVAGARQISPVNEKLAVILDEWNMVAVAIERVCLVIFICSFFIITLLYA